MLELILSFSSLYVCNQLNLVMILHIVQPKRLRSTKVIDHTAKPFIKCNFSAFWKHGLNLLFNYRGNRFQIFQQRPLANTSQGRVFVEYFVFDKAKRLKVECYTLYQTMSRSDCTVYHCRRKHFTRSFLDCFKPQLNLIALVPTNMLTEIEISIFSVPLWLYEHKTPNYILCNYELRRTELIFRTNCLSYFWEVEEGSILFARTEHWSLIKEGELFEMSTKKPRAMKSCIP